MNALTILYEDAALLVIDKPAGLPTLPSPRGLPDTVASLLVARYPEQKTLPDWGLVHRLDNDTSGILVAARTLSGYARLRALWNTEVVQKSYLALVEGHLYGSGSIEVPIAHHPRKKRKMIVDKTRGRPARTTWRNRQMRGENTLLEISIQTGVRHQIRVHLAFIGHPLVGDPLYPKKRRNSPLRANGPVATPLPYFLHLYQVTLPHPTIADKTVIVRSEDVIIGGSR